MERLDQTYLTNIITRAQTGSSNAFAEAYCATVQRHFMYLNFILGDEKRAEEMLKQAYVKIYRSLPSLHKAVLYMPWSARMIFRCAMEAETDNDWDVATPAGTFPVSSLLALPVSESQAAIMSYAQGMSVKDIGDILNFDSQTVRRCLRSANEHLIRGAQKKEENVSQGKYRGNEKGRALKEVKLDETKTAGLLEYIFETCDAKPNTVPLEALSAYTVYRKERFTLQRGVLAIAMVLFLLLPLLFILPEYEISGSETGVRGLPEYTVKISSVIPAGSVKAKINNHSLPVYEESGRVYTIEPTRNGQLTVEIELINRQSLKSVVDVEDVDSEGPVLTGSSADGEYVRITVNDPGIGVDYREVYAISQAGDVYYPVTYDEDNGEIIFDYPQESWDVYIPDHIGNMLHLAFTFDQE